MATEDKPEVKYPRWIKRDPNVGDVLVQNEEEEKKLLADWHARKPPTAAEVKAGVASDTKIAAETAHQRAVDRHKND